MFINVTDNVTPADNVICKLLLWRVKSLVYIGNMKPCDNLVSIAVFCESMWGVIPSSLHMIYFI